MYIQLQAKKRKTTSAERMRSLRKHRREADNIAPISSQQSNSLVTADINNENLYIDNNTVDSLQYSNFNLHIKARNIFEKQFKNNSFGYACFVCDRLWFQNDLRSLNSNAQQVLRSAFSEIDFSFDNCISCSSCRIALHHNHVPNLAKFHGFSYPLIPQELPKLDIVSERLISARLPFMQIRRLRHAYGQFGIFGQIINVPVDINNMVQKLPRNIDDDLCINVHIKRKSFHKSNYIIGLVNKRDIKIWLEYLISTPLYQMYNITVDSTFFSSTTNNEINRTEISEEIQIEESLVAQQQTLLWNEEYYLQIAPGEKSNPNSLLLDEHAEELSFPTIYLGQFRTFKPSLKVTPFMMATSEIRRSDRRGVTPQHLLYIAMKVMRLRVRDSLTIAFKHVGNNGNITRKQIESEDYINNCIEHNLAFLRCIPNSAWYWSQRKRDLFAMIRQLGKPTLFITMSANEIGWASLLQILYKLKNNGAYISAKDVMSLNFIAKTTLINEDAVTCAIYFNKLVNTLLNILKSKSSPFGSHFVEHFFKRIEFQHRGSPHAHILLWLHDAPKDPLGDDMENTISLIDELISVSAADSSSNIHLQTHKHTFTCYKNSINRARQTCRFDYPYMPSR